MAVRRFEGDVVPGRFGRVIALLLCVAALALAGCESDSGLKRPPVPTAPTGSQPFPTGSTAANVDCPKFEDVSRAIADAQAKLFTPGPQAAAAANALAAQLATLKEDTPGDVDAAIDDLLAAYREVADVIADPSPSADDTAKLRQLAPRASADVSKITGYIASKCK